MILTPGTYQEPDLSVDAVDSYTNGQLSKDDPATQYMLDAALAVARNDMRWHVNPVTFGEVISLNGRGGVKLWLPTKNVVALHSITDAVAGPITLPAGILFDADLPNKIYLNNLTTSQVWCHQFSGITVTWDHGFTNAAARDWRNAILALVTNIAQISVLGRSDAELEGKRIDDVDYTWAAKQALGSVEPTLAKYRMLSAWV
jgi:hypothetical protein